MITLSHVGLRYAGGPEVLSDIHLSLAPGSFHYLTGKSGSGKTSLMRLLHIGWLPTRGDIHIFETDLMAASRKKRAALRQDIGVIFQDFRLLPHLSLYDNIALPLRLRGHDETAIKNDIDHIADWIGLKDHLKIKPPFLSGGQQQRAAIARAVVTKPKILLADEPTGSLDDSMGHRIMALFEELNKSGTAIVVATHSESMIETFPHKRLHLEGGKITS